MSIWEWASWANVVILGVGAPIVFVLFLRDLKSLLAMLNSAQEALPPVEEQARVLEPIVLGSSQPEHVLSEAGRS
jgi:hypothetical protein